MVKKKSSLKKKNYVYDEYNIIFLTKQTTRVRKKKSPPRHFKFMNVKLLNVDSTCMDVEVYNTLCDCGVEFCEIYTSKLEHISITRPYRLHFKNIKFKDICGSRKFILKRLFNSQHGETVEINFNNCCFDIISLIRIMGLLSKNTITKKINIKFSMLYEEIFNDMTASNMAGLYIITKMISNNTCLEEVKVNLSYLKFQKVLSMMIAKCLNRNKKLKKLTIEAFDISDQVHYDLYYSKYWNKPTQYRLNYLKKIIDSIRNVINKYGKSIMWDEGTINKDMNYFISNIYTNNNKDIYDLILNNRSIQFISIPWLDYDEYFKLIKELMNKNKQEYIKK